MGRGEGYEVKHVLLQLFMLGKLRTPFLSFCPSAKEKGRKLKLERNLLCAKDFTYIISLKTLFVSILYLRSRSF